MLQLFVAEELSKALLLCFIADVPLSVEIVEDESERKSLLADGITEYTYTSNAISEGSRGRVNIVLRENEQNNIHASCECNFLKRMKLPSRHVLALGLTIDRDKDKSAQEQEISDCEALAVSEHWTLQ